MLDLLRARGDCIKFLDWKGLNAINKQINEKLAEDHEQARKNVEVCGLDDEHADFAPTLCDPICAFVSMESEEAYNMLSAIPDGTIKLGDIDSDVVEASEPTNIIWENYDFDANLRIARFIIIAGVICFALFLTFCVAFKAKATTTELTGKYDVSIKCSELSKIYSKEQLSSLAADEWLDYYKNGGQDEDRQIAGTLACFCTDEYGR